MSELRPAIEVAMDAYDAAQHNRLISPIIEADRRTLVDAIVAMLRGHGAIVEAATKKSRVNEYDRAISMGWVKGTNDAADLITQRFGGAP